MHFEKDEWDSWREHPLTVYFIDTFLLSRANEAKEKFIDYAWGNREIDPIYHASLYERYQVIDQIKNLTFEDMATD